MDGDIMFLAKMMIGTDTVFGKSLHILERDEEV
jgi:hypothetical protein